MVNASIKTRVDSKVVSPNFRALEEAKEAVVKLRTLKPFLSPRDEETLAILMDKELMHHLEKSLKEAEGGKLRPLHHILKVKTLWQPSYSKLK